MHSLPLVDELVIIAALGSLVTVVFSRLGLPAVTGLLSVGAMIGPFGLRWIRSIESIEVLSEVGVVLMLFTIGMEFSLERLRSVFKQAALGGLLQVGLTVASAIGLARLAGLSFGASIAISFLVSLSSTAIVLRALTERQEIDSPHGRFIVGTLIFQDLMVVPMALILPLLQNLDQGVDAGQLLLSLTIALGKALLLVLATWLISRRMLPWILARVDAARSREAFLLVVLALCGGLALLGSLAGLSLALGAFLAGLLVADTEFRHRAVSEMIPLRDLFVSVFFVSVGMLVEWDVLFRNGWLITGLVVALTLGKGLLAGIAASAMRFPPRVAWVAGMGLGQFSEFGFVLARSCRDLHLVEDAVLEPVLNAGILSMIAAPLIFRVAPHLTAGHKLLRPLEKLLGVRDIVEESKVAELRDHVVVVGFGLAGEMVCKSLAKSEIPYISIELNLERVRYGQTNNLRVEYADAAHPETLEHVALKDARALVVLINDPSAARRVIAAARTLAPNLLIVTRSRYLAECTLYLQAGANDAVAEELEGGLEVLARVLRKLEVTPEIIEARILEVREVTQPSTRMLRIPRLRVGESHTLADLRFDSVLISDGSFACGKTLAQLKLQQLSGALVVAVRRSGQTFDAPGAQLVFEAEDTVYLMGAPDALTRARSILTAGNPE